MVEIKVVTDRAQMKAVDNDIALIGKELSVINKDLAGKPNWHPSQWWIMVDNGVQWAHEKAHNLYSMPGRLSPVKMLLPKLHLSDLRMGTKRDIPRIKIPRVGYTPEHINEDTVIHKTVTQTANTDAPTNAAVQQDVPETVISEAAGTNTTVPDSDVPNKETALAEKPNTLKIEQTQTSQPKITVPPKITLPKLPVIATPKIAIPLRLQNQAMVAVLVLILITILGGFLFLQNGLTGMSMTEDEGFGFNNTITDAGGRELPVIIELINERGALVELEDKGKVQQGEYDVNINFTAELSPVKTITMHAVVVEDEQEEFVRVDDVPEEGPLAAYASVYAIDPTSVNFNYAEVTVKAKGSLLYKCKDWDFDNQMCTGQWQFLMEVVPGEEYTFTLTPEDPGFAEINATAASHLDAEYLFIGDIYPEIEHKDDVWSQRISDGEIIRVTYEQALQNGNVIDIYARGDDSTYVEVYKAGTTEPLLGTSKSFPGYGGWSYIVMRELDAPADTFDFRIVDGSSAEIGWAEFDYIHDGTKLVLAVTDAKGSGTYPTNGWTRSGGSNWADALGTQNSDTSYGYASSFNTNGVWDVEDTTASGTINNITIRARCRLDTASAGEGGDIQLAHFDQGVNAGASGQAWTASYANYTDTWTTNPFNSSNPFQWGNIANLEVMIVSQKSGGNSNSDWRCTYVEMEVDYTPSVDNPPATVTSLVESQDGQDWLYWTWTNPVDADFSHAEVWIDDEWAVNTSDAYYNATGLKPATNYTIQILTTDTGGNTNSTWVNSTDMTEIIDIELNASVYNALNQTTNTTIQIINTSSDETIYNDTGNQHQTTLAQGTYKVRIIPHDCDKVDEIIIEEAELLYNQSHIIAMDRPETPSGFNSIYVINPLINFTNATIVSSANNTAGNTMLYKCEDWNFTTRTCDGQWFPYMNITPGQPYNITIDPVDPGFAEGSPSTGTPDAGWVVDNDGDDEEGGTYASTWYNDNIYFWAGELDNSVNANSEIILVYNISNLGIDRQYVTGIQVNLTYCHSGEDPTPDCDGDDPSEKSMNTPNVWAYNFSSGGWVDIGNMNLTWILTEDEHTASWNVTGNASDYVNSTNHIMVKYESITSSGAGPTDSSLVIDYAPIAVTYTSSSGLLETVSNLQNASSGSDWITWTWTNPGSPWESTIIYLNGTNIANTTASSYTAEGLTPATDYNLTLHTKNSTDINDTDVTNIAPTLPAGQLTVDILLPGNNITVKRDSLVKIVANVTCSGGSTEKCGNLTASVRRNTSTTDPDTAISTTQGDTPLYVHNKTEWSSQINITVGCNNCRGVSSGDMDGDGDIDVVAVEYDSNIISWWENNGYEGFTEHAVIGYWYQSIWADTGDVDNDGDMDVLSAEYNAVNLSWFENDGTGSFTERLIYGSSNIGHEGSFYDMDNDGDLDVITAEENNNAVTWYENDNGDGSSWTTHTINSSYTDASSIAAGDIDGDGDTDVATMSRGAGNMAGWHENLGSDSWTFHNLVEVNDGRGSGISDLDGDGDMDLVFADRGNNTVIWLENDGSESFTQRVVDDTLLGPYDIILTDVDYDGDIDVFAPSFDDTDYAYYENNGTGTFTKQTMCTDCAYATSINLVDIDGEGDQDMLVALRDADTIVLYKNEISTSTNPKATNLSYPAYQTNDSWSINWWVNATGESGTRMQIDSLFASTFSGVTSTATDNRSVCTDECPTDAGYLEVKVNMPANETIVQPGDLISFNATVTCQGSDGSTCGSVRALARYGTSTPDTAISNLTGATPFHTVWNWTFIGETAYTTTSNPDPIHTVDLDGDGDMDIIAGDLGTSVEDLYWLENDGSASFTYHQIDGTIGGVYAVDAADIDGDGDIDVIVGNSWDTYDLTWYENNGAESFTEHQISLGGTHYDAALSDLDNDGDPDLIIGSYNYLAWAENNGTGGFTQTNLSTKQETRSQVLGADINNDNLVDIIETNNSGKIALWINDGTQAFRHQTISTSQTAGKSTHPIDLDRDGDVDIVATFMNNITAWYENDGSESFTEHNITTDLNYPEWSQVSDIDNDGDYDVIIGENVGSSVKVMENLGNLSFTQHTIDTPGSVRQLVIADYNGDGTPDIAATELSTERIRVYLNNVTATAQPKNHTDIMTAGDTWDVI